MPLPSGALGKYPLTANPTNFYGPSERRLTGWALAGGWTPNFSKWRPGDILVFERLPLASTAAGAMADLIEAFQKRMVQPQALPFTFCTHCAVYIGDGLIADSRLRRHVGVRRLYPETLKRGLCVLRLRSDIGTSRVVARFVDEVLSLEDTKYGANPSALINWATNNFISGTPKGLVCSALIEVAAKRAGVLLSSGAGIVGPMLPANLMVHPYLQLVPAEWCRTL